MAQHKKGADESMSKHVIGVKNDAVKKTKNNLVGKLMNSLIVPIDGAESRVQRKTWSTKNFLGRLWSRKRIK
jgi:hypothetical protein